MERFPRGLLGRLLYPLPLRAHKRLLGSR